MFYDLLIKNAFCFDSAQNIYETRDLAIKENRIVKFSKKINENALRTIDAKGHILTAGLIDFHTHVYSGGTDIGINADIAYIPTGVTTVVDAGSAGSANFEAYIKNCVLNSVIRIKSFINVSPTGLGTMKFHECVSPKFFDIEKTKFLVEKYRENIVALKIRASSDIVGKEGIEPVLSALEFAQKINLPLAVHTTNSPVLAGDLATLLRKNDIYIHCYHGTGNNIIEEGKVSEKICIARKKGVIFDAANGGNHWSFAVAEKAMNENFYPDVISTDLTVKTLHNSPVYSLPYIMSKYLNMKMPLEDIIKSCTETPARLIGMADTIGTLKEGALADISILKIIDKKTRYVDTNKEERFGDKLIVNKMTIKDGKILYRAIDF